MKTLLICNTILLAILAGLATFCFVSWLRSEKKLAKHNESTIFKKKED